MGGVLQLFKNKFRDRQTCNDSDYHDDNANIACVPRSTTHRSLLKFAQGVAAAVSFQCLSPPRVENSH